MTLLDAPPTPVEDAVLPPEPPRPTGSYAVLTAAYVGSAGLGLLAARRAGLKLVPPRWSDLILVALATQKVSRVVSKDRVTSWVRAPFAEPGEPGAPSEVNDAPRGTGLRRAVGELLTCPFCLNQWVGTAFTAGLVTRPRETRAVAGAFAAVGIADLAQVLYGKVKS